MNSGTPRPDPSKHPPKGQLDRRGLPRALAFVFAGSTATSQIGPRVGLRPLGPHVRPR